MGWPREHVFEVLSYSLQLTRESLRECSGQTWPEWRGEYRVREMATFSFSGSLQWADHISSSYARQFAQRICKTISLLVLLH